MASPQGSSRIDLIVAEYFSKSLHIILDSRIPGLPSTPPLPSPRGPDAMPAPMGATLPGLGSGSLSSGSSSSPSLQAPNQWFHLELEPCEIVQEVAEPWRRASPEPLVVDILLQQPHYSPGPPSPSGRPAPPSPSSHTTPSEPLSRPTPSEPPSPSGRTFPPHQRHLSPQGSGATPVPSSHRGGDDRASSLGSAYDGFATPTYTVLERWVIQYERRRWSGGGGGSQGSPGAPLSGTHAIEVPVVYKRTVILLRSLLAMTRLLPSYRLFRLAKGSRPMGRRGSTTPATPPSSILSYRVSSAPSPLASADAADMSTCRFVPVDTPAGRMLLTVAYRHTTAVTALEVGPPLQPRIIADYVGSPTTDPLRRFPQHSPGSVPASGRRGVHVVPFVPSSSPSSAPAALHRRHSWGSPSPAGRNFPPPSSPSPRHASAQRSPAGMSLQPTSSSPIPINDDDHRAPHPPSHPSTPSPSPSPPTPSSTRAPYLPRSASAPVSIPHPPHHPSSHHHAHNHHAPRPVTPVHDPPTSSSGSPGYPPAIRAQHAHHRRPSSRSRSSFSSPSDHMPLPSGSSSGLSTPGLAPIPRPWTSSSPPRPHPSSAPSGAIFPEGWDHSSRSATPTPVSESGESLAAVFSPPLPFACTPRTSRASSGSEGSAEPLPLMLQGQLPVAGNDGATALSLTKYPSFSIIDPKAAARLSISPLASSSLLLSSPHPLHHLRGGHPDDKTGGPTLAVRRPLYGLSRISMLGGSKQAAAGEVEDEDDSASDDNELPFAVDDVEGDGRAWRAEDISGWGGGDSGGFGPGGFSEEVRGSDAAVGALVRVLRTATLRAKQPPRTPLLPSQTPAMESASNTGRCPHAPTGPGSTGRLSWGGSGGGGVTGIAAAQRDRLPGGLVAADPAKERPTNTDGEEWMYGRPVTPPGPRKVREALEELRAYSELKEGLLRQRGHSGSSAQGPAGRDENLPDDVVEGRLTGVVGSSPAPENSSSVWASRHLLRPQFHGMPMAAPLSRV